MTTKLIKKLLTRLNGDTSGNAMLLVAMGAPVLFGTTGLAVDTAQWYMWQRELQYAADQAALAGAWARGTGDTGTEYKNRASQEFSANVSIVNNYTTLENSALADYGSGTNNSVVVTASTTGTLPFANLILKSATTVRVSAQATYEHKEQYTACLLALDKTQGKSVWLHGSISLKAPCGMGAVSTAVDAIRSDGNADPNYDVGWVISGGGVSDVNGNFGSAEIVKNSDSVSDPFEGLTPPDNQTPRSITCGTQAESWEVTRTTLFETTYKYYTKSGTTYTLTTTFPYAKSPTEKTTVENKVIVTTNPVDSGPVGPVPGTMSVPDESPKGTDKVYEEPNVTTTTTYTNIHHNSPEDGNLNPGTYAGFDPGCDVTLNSGVYVINGGTLNLNGQHKITGNGVMFVLKNGAGLQVNGGAEIELSPMSLEQLIAAGVAADKAKYLLDMLIFEDPNSAGNTGNKFNGNAKTSMKGVIYLPNSGVDLKGTMKANLGKQVCLMIAAKTLEIGGNADLSSMCKSGDVNNHIVAGGGTRVRLVA